MTLDDYRKHLCDLDKRCGYTEGSLFDTAAEQIDYNRFSYVFNGLLTCETEFLDDGTVRDVVDGYEVIYSDIAEWKNRLVKQLTENFSE